MEKHKNFSHWRRSLLFFAVLALLCCVKGWAGIAFAEDISFEATVDANKIPMGSAGQLVLTVHGSQDVEKILLPPIDGIESRYVGPSTQVRVINGTYSTAKAFTYMLLPLKEGTFVVPPVELDIKGQVYRSEPITIQVVPSSGGASAAGGDPALDPQGLADKVRMVIFAPRAKCYVNEELPVLIKLYVQGIPMQDITIPDIRQEGFVLSEYNQPRQYEETLDGRRFHVVEFSTRMTPLHPGRLSIGPAVIGANLVYKTNIRRNPFGRSDAFGDEFFAGIFGGYEKRPITITARPVDLEVADLPADGVPEGFSGAVGRFTFDADVAPVKVKAGDPLTLRMTVSGVGNLKTIVMPSVKDERFKVYDPQVKEEDGRKVLEQVLIATTEDLKEVPAVKFSYFDVESGQYQMISRGPFPIEVAPPEKGEEFQAIGFSEKAATFLDESLGKDIIFIKEAPGAWRQKGGLLERERLFFGVLVVFLNMWIAFFVFLLHYRRVSLDASYARRAVAYKEFRLSWKACTAIIANGSSREFYDALTTSLRLYLAAKLKISGDLSSADWEGILGFYKVDAKNIRKLQDVLRTADQVRFGGALAGEKEMKRDHLDIEEVVEAIERRVR